MRYELPQNQYFFNNNLHPLVKTNRMQKAYSSLKIDSSEV